METTPVIPVAPRWPDRALIGLFFVFLILPVLDLAFHIDPTAPPSENRLHAPFPPPPEGLGGLKKFLAGWEAYFNDHFGCRRVLVTWHNKLKWSLFHEKSVRNVLLGKEGWMFFSASEMVEHFRGALQFKEADLMAWQKLLEHRRDWLARRGIQYIFVLAPDKQSIYQEYLPSWLADLGGYTMADQFLDYMHAHSTVPVLDLRPALIEAKKSAPIYQKTDTHWNQYGAFMACEDIVRTLATNQVPGLIPLPLADFDRTNRLAPAGDLARGIGISMAESNAVFFTPGPVLPPLELSIPPDNERQRDPAYAKNPRGTGRVVVFHDSFGRYWVPFLGYQFGTADFYWQYNLDARLIESPKPVVVINEMLERFLTAKDPQQLYRDDALK